MTSTNEALKSFYASQKALVEEQETLMRLQFLVSILIPPKRDNTPAGKGIAMAEHRDAWGFPPDVEKDAAAEDHLQGLVEAEEAEFTTLDRMAAEQREVEAMAEELQTRKDGYVEKAFDFADMTYAMEREDYDSIPTSDLRNILVMLESEAAIVKTNLQERK